MNFDKKSKWYTVKVEVKEDSPMYVHASSEEEAIGICKVDYGRVILDVLKYKIIREGEDEE